MNRRSLLSLLACTPVFAKSKSSAWQKGELLAMDVQRIPINTKKMRYRYTYTIHGSGHAYVFDDRAKLNLTINGPVEYALDGDKIIVRDEGGKEHKETILQKAVDRPAQ
jgi:hypothetical protein